MKSLLYFSLSCLLTAQVFAATEVKPEERSQIEVVFVLDTTSSMGGMIEAAKQKIWAIANSLASAKPTPEIKLGLVAFRDRGDAYVTKRTPLTADLDAVYKDLMGFRPVGGGDGPESVNQALAEAVDKMEWSKDKDTYKVIFLVGDAPPKMNYKEQQYPKTCELAVRQDIIINTILCGTNTTARGHWQKIARLSEGNYFQVEQSGGAVIAATPFDKRLAELGRKMETTSVHYGSRKELERAREAVVVAEEIAKDAPSAALASRAEFKAKGLAGPKSSGRDLVAEVAEDETALKELEKLDKDQMDPKLAAMTPEERREHVKALAARRAKLQEEILTLSKKRQAHIAAQVKASGKKDSLDEGVFRSLKTQAAKKSIKLEDGPTY